MILFDFIVLLLRLAPPLEVTPPALGHSGYIVKRRLSSAGWKPLVPVVSQTGKASPRVVFPSPAQWIQKLEELHQHSSVGSGLCVSLCQGC